MHEKYPLDNWVLVTNIRRRVLQMSHDARSSHIGSCLSCADILAVLYGSVLNVDPANPKHLDRDIFILGKGHACAVLYAVLAEKGFIPIGALHDFYKRGALTGHANCHVQGVEVSTGSLGHGLSISCGFALVRTSKVIVLLGDGDCQEGATWEAALFATQHNLDNLTVIIDYNKSQALGATKNILSLYSLVDKWQAFGWKTRDVDGHNLTALENIFRKLPLETGHPTCIVAHTVKGKGVSWMEGKTVWHYRSPNDEELEKALAELEVK